FARRYQHPTPHHTAPLAERAHPPPLFALHHSARVMVIAALAQVLLGSRRDRFFPSISATEWRGIPLVSHHRLTPDELQFVHDRAADWPEELRLRILHGLPERTV